MSGEEIFKIVYLLGVVWLAAGAIRADLGFGQKGDRPCRGR